MHSVERLSHIEHISINYIGGDKAMSYNHHYIQLTCTLNSHSFIDYLCKELRIGTLMSE